MNKATCRSNVRDLPDWIKETPFECEYELVMNEGGCDHQACQQIELTRAEYVRLKIFLAKLRGVQVPASDPGGGSGVPYPSLWEEVDSEEIARIAEPGAPVA